MFTSAATFLFLFNLFVGNNCFIIEKELELDNHPCRAKNLKVQFFKKSKYSLTFDFVPNSALIFTLFALFALFSLLSQLKLRL